MCPHLILYFYFVTKAAGLSGAGRNKDQSNKTTNSTKNCDDAYLSMLCVIFDQFLRERLLKLQPLLVGMVASQHLHLLNGRWSSWRQYANVRTKCTK